MDNQIADPTETNDEAIAPARKAYSTPTAILASVEETELGLNPNPDATTAFS
ncbi:MAG TPA: hypothetical protein VGG29_11425 [Caulobacteraceae bacterium]|jgi:hypothetical protein